MMATDFANFAIITDLGGVLVDVDKRKMSAEMAKYSALSATEILSSFSSAKLTRFDLGFGKGLLAPRSFYKAAAAKLKLSGLCFEDFARIYSDVFKRKDDTIKLLRQLGKKYALALLSNTDALHYKEWSRLLGNDMNLFKEVILSFQLHTAKPERKIFLAAVKKLKVKPKQCVYIDDVKEYADAATKAGMKGVHFTSVRQLRKDLGKTGIKV